tara:strand:- start:277 stop:510 length:234 start_codon:yes stop_codon:yes gene_type:complete
MKTSVMMRCPKCEKTSELDNIHLLDRSFKRDWVGLTRTQMQDVYFEVLKEYRGGPQMDGQLAFGEALQAKLKEKNNA